MLGSSLTWAVAIPWNVGWISLTAPAEWDGCHFGGLFLGLFIIGVVAGILQNGFDGPVLAVAGAVSMHWFVLLFLVTPGEKNLWLAFAVYLGVVITGCLAFGQWVGGEIARKLRRWGPGSPE